MDRNKTKLLKKIGQCCHMLNDLNLYLDTHPHSPEALRAYEKYQKAHKMYKEDYEKNYGMLNPGMNDNTNETKWKWIDGPWPWERAANESEDR